VVASRVMSTRTIHRALATMAVLPLSAWLAATGCSSKDCVTLCQEGQAGTCTAIKGDCARFCDALDTVEDPSGCVDQRTAYEECLNDKTVCDATCDDQESALGVCVAVYCNQNPQNADCQTLLAAY
jgi:hypothetical protein